MEISTDEDPSLRIESSAIVNLRGVSTKLCFNLIFPMQTYKELRMFRAWNMLANSFFFFEIKNASLNYTDYRSRTRYEW